MRVIPEPDPGKDILGLELSLRDALVGNDELLDRVRTFCARFRDLDNHQLKTRRAKEFKPLEPCIVRGGPGVVLSVGVTRVSVRRWVAPHVQPDEPMPCIVRWYTPAQVRKVGTGKDWAEWQRMMGLCGHSSEHWTARDFEALSDD